MALTDGTLPGTQPTTPPRQGYTWQFVDGEWIEVPINPGPSGPTEPTEPGGPGTGTDWRAQARSFLEGLAAQYKVPIDQGDEDTLAGYGADMTSHYAEYALKYARRAQGGPDDPSPTVGPTRGPSTGPTTGPSVGPTRGPGTLPPGTGGTGGVYTLPGGQTYFDFPVFDPGPFDYPDFQAPEWNVKPLEVPAPTAGEWTPPSWDVKPYEAAAPFEYPEFEGPTAETFKADPGYDFREKAMTRAVKQNKAAEGLLRSGMTLTDLMNYQGGLASQEFGNVWNRDFQGWQANRGAAADAADRNERNRLQAYKEQYGAESDEYQRAVTDYNVKRAADQDAFQREITRYGTEETSEANKFNRALTTHLTGYGRKSDDWNRNLTTYNTNLNAATGGYGLNLDTGAQALSRDNSRWANLLSLYNLATRTLPKYDPQALPTYP